MAVTIIRPEKVDPIKVKILEQAIIDICVAAHVEPARIVRPGHPEDKPEDFYTQVVQDNEAWHERRRRAAAEAESNEH